MDFRLGEKSDAFRAEVREFLEQAMTPELDERLYRSGVSHDDEFTQKLVERGWLGSNWPAEYGGQERSAYEVVAFRQETSKVDAPMYGTGTTLMVAKIILHLGTEQQKREILPKALRGELIIVLGFSEPEAGSDVAAAQTKAVRDGDEWVINGQKMFTTNAHIADYAFLLTRTNPEVAKHKGLTMFLVPLKQPGVEVQAVYTLSGERTNIVFYNDVRVSDAWRIGDVDRGWSVLTVSLQDEHSGGFSSRLGALLERTEAWARETMTIERTPVLDDPDVRTRLGRVATEHEVSRLLELRAVWMGDNGLVPEAEGPMAKLFSSEAMTRAAQDLTELVGPDALRSYFEPTAPQGGKIEHALRFSLGTTIYAGTSEVQRNIIAQRGLGLPR